MSIERLSGRIKTISEFGNYGYIMGDTGKESFFHESDCLDFTPDKGMLVEYQLGEDRSGRQKAVNIEQRVREVSYDQAN